jgi:hypothetical protein
MQEKIEVFEKKNLTQVTLSTINPTRTNMELKPGLQGEKAVSDSLSYGTGQQYKP